jgi:hypothetical protein
MISADAQEPCTVDMLYISCVPKYGRLCGPVFRFFGYKSGAPVSIPGTTSKKVVGLERSPLSLVRTTEELLDIKVAATV